jgi:uncharacterized membrane protein YkvA (DUF1232 family)
MSWWQWLLISVGLLVAVYGAFLGWLVIRGRRDDARALLTLISDCVILVSRLAGDPRVTRRRELLLLALAGYLALPFDLVPDSIPIAGQLDDAIMVALILRRFVRSGGEGLIRELWPGPEQSQERPGSPSRRRRHSSGDERTSDGFTVPKRSLALTAGAWIAVSSRMSSCR